MKPNTGAILAVLLIAVVLVPTAASAHSPLGAGDNESLATATPVPEPTKSWAIYAQLHEGGEAQYYQFDMLAGQRIYVQLFTSTAPEDANFTPSMALMGPGILKNETAPAYVEMPAGAGKLVLAGVRPAQATYEAFAPSSFVQLAIVSMDAPANGTFVVAVFDEVRGGHYGLAIGERESFTASAWMLMPFDLLSVYTWERQDLALVLAPAIAVMAVGIGLLVWRQRKGVRMALPAWAGAIAGLSFLASGATVLGQMLLSMSRAPAGGDALITAIFVSLPLVLGLVTLRMTLRRGKEWTVRSRAYLIVVGALALVLWSGWIAGPIVAMVAAALPAKAVAESEQNVAA
jgi:hypothetical protein